MKQPGMTAVAVLSLALGVGVATTAFTVLNAMALRDLPGVVAQDRLLTVGVSREDRGERRLQTLLSVPDVKVLARHKELFSGVTGAGRTEVAVEAGGEPTEVPAEVALSNYFEVLGTRPELGRFFAPEEDEPGASTVVVSHAFWQSRLGGDPDVVGSVIRVNGRPFTVIGVAPEHCGGAMPEDVTKADGGLPVLWLSFGAAELARAMWVLPGQERSVAAEWLDIVMRLRDGVTPERVASALPVVSSELERAYPDERAGAKLVMGDIIFGAGRGEGWAAMIVSMFMAVPLLVLLIAAANAANLLLARTLSRKRELAVRAALGASRGALVRVVVAESLLIALAAGALGLVVAVWSRQMAGLVAVRITSAPLDLRVFAFVLVSSVSVGLFFGLIPALSAGRPAAGAALGGASRSGETPGTARVRRGLVVAQVALSVVMLVVSGLFVRSVRQGMTVDSGLAEDGLVLFRLDLNVLHYDAPRGRALYSDVLAGVRALPEVKAAAWSDIVPFAGLPTVKVTVGSGDVTVLPSVGITRVGEGWFDAAGLPLLSGQAQGAGHRWARGVVAVNRALADRLWPDGGVEGRTVRLGEGTEAFQVVAVTANARSRLYEDAAPVVYLPFDKIYIPQSILYVQAGDHPERLARAVRDVVRWLDPALPLHTVETAAQLRRRTLLPWRLMARAMAVLGGVALVLAVVGLYGVVSFSVARRTREIGVRMAMGATRQGVVGMVMRQGLATVAVGLVVGSALAAGVAELVRWAWFGVSPLDPATYVAIAAILALVSAIAVLGPARRAASVEPVRALVED